MPFQTYSQLHHELPPHHPDKSRVWRYPKNHVFFRSRMSVKPSRPLHSQFHDSDPVDGETSNVPHVEKEYPGKGVAGEDGSLEKLTRMPVDILYEVCSLLPESSAGHLACRIRLRRVPFVRWIIMHKRRDLSSFPEKC
ncbi:hypothetical protein GALMADRAFT_1271443 [Galerina marginata CBS 339.88]|uniref:Uncharacterized protein n=1 Tax=Galerina marginata (strain CBS 339.88) TaxID=685588 RepID=A0A067T6Q2_GALM3|nr:hypothetical protein GALMADRAFT_1271443 [Galerina marginata CBS 339.88]